VTIGDFKRDSIRRRKPAITADVANVAPGRRKKSRGRLWLILLIGMILLVAAAPSLICQSPFAETIFRQTAANYAIDGGFKAVRVGWVTPLRIKSLDLAGASGGSRFHAEQIDCNITLLKILGGLREPIKVSARGVVVDATVGDGWSSLEQDLAAIIRGDDNDSSESKDIDQTSGGASALECWIEIQGMSVKITDAVNGEVSGLDQLKADAKWANGNLDLFVSAIVSDAKTGSGAFETTLSYDAQGDRGASVALVMQSLPVRVVSLVRRRFPVDAASIPMQMAGDATGSLRLSGGGVAAWSMDAEQVEVRNLIASDPTLGEAVWRNSLMVMRGKAVVDHRGIVGDNLRLSTDFADLSLNGVFATPTDSAQMANPIAWLTALDGTATGSINLATMVDRLPGVLPLREQTQIVSGSITAEITSKPAGPGARLVNTRLSSDPIRAKAANRNVVVEPVSLVAAMRVDAVGNWRADQCHLTSAFGTATLDGELAQGRAAVDFDLGRLAAMLDPIVDMPEWELGGVATGQLQWSAQAGESWRMQGDANATNLTIGLPGGTHLHRPTLAVQVDAAGRWASGKLQELTVAELTLQSESLEADVVLVESIVSPGAETRWPLRVSGRGRLEVLGEFLSPWLPVSLHSLNGGFEGHAEAVVGSLDGEVLSVKVKLQEPRGAWEDQLFAQSQLSIGFEGNYAWPSGNVKAESLTIAGESISGAAKGVMTTDAIDLELAWRANLELLQATRVSRIAQAPSNGGPTRFASAPKVATSNEGQWSYSGKCEGNARVIQMTGRSEMSIETHATGTQLAVLQAPASAVNSPSVGRPGAGAVIWAEPNVRVDGVVIYNTVDGGIAANKLNLVTDWVATSLSGQVVWNETQGAIKLNGPATIRMEEVAKQLSHLAGTPIRLEGTHETPLAILVSRRPDGSSDLNVTANLGWESGEIAGVVFGPSAIPVAMNETTIAIRNAVVPVDEGRITVSADVHYQPGPLWMDVKPGVIAENLRMTPELSDRWLQYLAPMVAQATRIDGTFGVELSEAKVNLDEPMKSRVRGQLQINQVAFDAGPVANQLLGSIEQIQMIAKGRVAEATPQDKNRTLAKLPTQSVDFDFTDGLITHQRMFMVVDRATVITSGQVHVNGNLALMTQVPLDASWLGSDLKALAGKTITMPIGGTLSRPRLDPTAIRNLVTQLGTQAIQSQAENYLEKQLNRGIDKLLGK